MSGKHFLKTYLILASEKPFFSCWKPFSIIASDIFQGVLHTGWWKHIFQSRRKGIAFYLELSFPAGENHYLNYRQTCLKLLSLLLATVFFSFSDIPPNESFWSNRKVFLNEFFIPASGNQFYVYLMYSYLFFYLEIFFV